MHKFFKGKVIVIFFYEPINAERLILKFYERSETMYLIKIYLNNGVIIDFKCEQYEITRSSSTGGVAGYRFENANKNIAFLNKTEIVAITGENI